MNWMKVKQMGIRNAVFIESVVIYVYLENYRTLSSIVICDVSGIIVSESSLFLLVAVHDQRIREFMGIINRSSCDRLVQTVCY